MKSTDEGARALEAANWGEPASVDCLAPSIQSGVVNLEVGMLGHRDDPPVMFRQPLT